MLLIITLLEYVNNNVIKVSDTCCEPSSSDSLVVNDSSVNSVGDKPSDREDNQCTNLVTMEPNRDVIQVATSDISELCLKGPY